MRKDIRQSVALILIMAMAVSLAPLTTRAQRPGRPPARDFEGTPVLAAGIEVVPEGTYILLEMETRLDSKNSRQSDRFKARVAAPVVDAQGRTLVPEAAYVEGHVSAVTPARWRRRSGIIAIEFDNLYLPNGESVPIRGYLTSADAADRKRIDDEGSIRGGAPRKRDIVFIGGGVAAGAAIGWIAGGALAGAGIGAAVGLTATFLMKGVEAVVEEGDRIALGLTEDLRIEPAGEYLSQPKPAPSRTDEERSEFRPLNPPNPTSESRPEREKPTEPPSSSLSSGAVNLNAIRSERGSDGLLRILITAETPTTGWRIFTNHEILRDSVEIRLQGTPPPSSAPRQLSHPTAPTIVIQDSNKRIQKIVVHGRNTVQTIAVNNSWTDRAGGGRQSSSATPARPTSRPSGNATNPPANSSAASEPGVPAEGASASLIETASRIEKDIDLIRFNFASSIGIWLNRDGTFDALTGRRPTTDEKRFLDGLGALATSVRTWHFNSPTESARRTSILRIREDAQVVESSWRRISMSNETNQLVREMLARVAILVK